jgi:hypothetical protein
MSADKKQSQQVTVKAELTRYLNRIVLVIKLPRLFIFFISKKHFAAVLFLLEKSLPSLRRK